MNGESGETWVPALVLLLMGGVNLHKSFLLSGLCFPKCFLGSSPMDSASHLCSNVKARSVGALCVNGGTLIYRPGPPSASWICHHGV